MGDLQRCVAEMGLDRAASQTQGLEGRSRYPVLNRPMRGLECRGYIGHVFGISSDREVEKLRWECECVSNLGRKSL